MTPEPQGESAVPIAALLRLASPFQNLEPARLEELARRLNTLEVEAGEEVVRQGEAGDRCFLVQEGELEVLQSGAGGARSVAMLGAGTLFGEAALLTDSPRNATVRATRRSRLLSLSRADLQEALSWNRLVGPALFELLWLRERPRRRAGVSVEDYRSVDAEALSLLKDGARSGYFRLSSLGRFVWDRLDGEHNLKDLALEALAQRGSFCPHAIAEIVGGLAAAGFLEGDALRAAALRAESPSPWSRVRGVLLCRAVLRGVDAPIARLYRRLRLDLLFTRPARLLMGAVALVGAATFARQAPALASWEGGPSSLLAPLLVSLAVIIVTHDAAHAAAVKFFGREVLGVGVGWNWFAPVLFVDTSDMWPAAPPQRIVVHLAGLWTNLVLAGAAALAAGAAPGSTGGARLLLFAALSYAIVAFNLLPMLDSDGHYAWRDFREWRSGRPSKKARE